MSKKNITDPSDPAFDLESFLNAPGAVDKLDDKEFETLEIFLESQSNGMHMEIMDGFFCGLICAQEATGPEEYVAYIFGGKEPEYASPAQAEEILGYLRKHWDHIKSTLEVGESYYPFLYSDDNFKVSANDWALGFVLGLDKYREVWNELLADTKNEDGTINEEGLLTPILTLYLEKSSPDGPIHAEDREKLVTTLIENMPRIYDYFVQKQEEQNRGALH